jgi:hypothetical protein
LVTSFDPLKIYVFSDFYLRICGTKYDINDIKDPYKHITNFSIQKNNQKVNNTNYDLVMSQKNFFQKVLKSDNRKCQTIRSKMEEIIIKTIKTG